MQKKLGIFGLQDMTTGTPWKKLLAFSFPLLLGNLAQQLYSTVDSMVVGRYVGDTALAAVGASFPILNLMLVLMVGISVGASIMVSQYFGARDRAMLSRTIGTTLTLTFVVSILIMAVGFLVTRPALRLLGTPEDTYEGAAAYLTILFGGMVGCAYYNILAGILRGLGDSIRPLVYLLIATLLNIALDILFVAGFGWGVAGVAWATIIAQAISAALCMVKLLRAREHFDFNRSLLKPDRTLTVQLAKLGLPSGVTQGIFAMAQIVVQSLTNSFGTLVIACSIVVMRVDGFAMMPNFTFGTAMTTFSGQNIGANRMERVDQGTKSGLIMGLLVSTVMVVLILIFGESLMRLFTDTEEVIELGVRMLRLLAVGYIAMSVMQILGGVMRGAGDTVTPMWISIITTVAIRVPVAYLIAHLTGKPESIFVSLLVSWTMGTLITVICYRMGRWRNKRIVS